MNLYDTADKATPIMDDKIDAGQAHRRMMELLDRAAVTALASGIPHHEMWIQHARDGTDTRLMRGSGGPPKVGEISTGEVVARVWLVPFDLNKFRGEDTDWTTELRYEGIAIESGIAKP